MANTQTFSFDDAGRLTSEVTRMCNEHAHEITETVRFRCGSAAKNAAKYLKENSAIRTGAYRKGWTATEDTTDSWAGGFRFTVHNNAKPSLTHLLEIGHQKRDGGWVEGDHLILAAYQQFEPRL